MLTAKRIAQMYKETRPFFQKYGYKDVVPVQWFDTNDIAIGAIPGQTQFFNVANVFAVCNLEQPNEFPNPTIILAIGVQIFGTHADAAVVFEHTEVAFEKDSRVQPSMPTCAVPGGGGVRAMASQTNAAAIQVASNGLGNSFRRLHSPIAVDSEQSIRAWLYGDAVAAVAAATGVRIILEGIEWRLPV